MSPSKGQWISPHGVTFIERMIPVRIIANQDQIHDLLKMTAEHYDQEEVLCYKISDEVIFYKNPGVKNLT
jgi:hypothetical protein